VAGGRDGIYFRQSLGKPSPAAPAALQGISRPISTDEPQYCQQCGAQWIQDNRYCIQCGAEAQRLSACPIAAQTKQHSVWMWAAALIAGVWLIAYLGSLLTNSTREAPQVRGTTQGAAPVPALNSDFWVQPQIPGHTVTIVVPTGTSVDKIESMIRFFRLKIKSGGFVELGITQPTHVRSGGGTGDYSAGKIAFRKKGLLHQKSASDNEHGWNRAEYQWGIKQRPNDDKAQVWIDRSRAVNVF
jgi:hypothetical protein